MKKILTLTLFCITISVKAQTIGIQQLENVTNLKSIEEKCNFFYSKNFVKDISIENSKTILVKKKFDKRLQNFDQEIITIENDTITYSLISPKKYIKLKEAIEYYSYKKITNQSSIDSKTYYEKKRFIVKLFESKVIDETSKVVLFYNFSIYKNKI